MAEHNLPFEEQIAIVAHEANRAYCATLGDNSQPDWKDAPQWQQDSARQGVFFHLSKLRNGQKPSPAASHESWLEEKRRDGWSYGPVKDPAKKQHPCFIPYEGLPLDQRMKDYIFSAIVEAFYVGSTVEVPVVV